jgi:hypothetical protein
MELPFSMPTTPNLSVLPKMMYFPCELNLTIGCVSDEENKSQDTSLCHKSLYLSSVLSFLPFAVPGGAVGRPIKDRT